jgi:hypothetical protein
VTQGLSSWDGHEGASAPAFDDVAIDDVPIELVAVDLLAFVRVAVAFVRGLAPRGTA